MHNTKTMKRLLILMLATVLVSPVFAQRGNRITEKDKTATFGFDFGINRSNLSFGEDINSGEDITNGLGYRLGIVSNFRISKRFSFAPKAELSFNASRISQDNTEYKVNATNLEFMGHLRYKFRQGAFSPYVIAGPNFRVPITTNLSSNDFVPTKQDVAIDLGAGLDVPLGSIMLSPELRYSFGIADINSSSDVSDLKYHNIALTLIFRGR